MSAINPLFRVVSPIRSTVLPPAHTSTPDTNRYIPAAVNIALMMLPDYEVLVNHASYSTGQYAGSSRC